MAENSTDVVVHVRDGRFVWISPSVDSLLGAPAEYWVGREVREIFPRSDLAAWAERVKTVTMGGVVKQRYRVNSVDGVIHWVDAHSKPFYGEDGCQDGSIATLRLIDDQLAAEQALEESRRLQTLAEERYRRAMEHAALAMCLVTPEGRLQEVNDAACRLFGYDAETLKQKTWQELTPPEYLDKGLKDVTDLHEGRIDSFRITKQYIHADGHLIWVDLSVSCLRDQEGRVESEVALITDITAEVVAREQLERKRQAEANERLRRAMENAGVGMCLMNSEGRVEEINREMCRFLGYDSDTLLQKTWDEVTDPDYREENWTNIKAMLKGHIDSYRMINQYVHAHGHKIWGDHSVTCIRDEHGRVENFLVQVTDVTPVERELRERLEFEEFLSRAITEGRLVAYTQPIVDARTGRLVEEELLVRIVGSDGQVMVPDEFLPQAQRFGMMPTIDRFMVARGIALARAGRRVAVNLSADSINDPDTIAAIFEKLRQAGDAAARVSFEITETTALASTEVANRFSSDMSVLGCRLALDDFGTGFGTFTDLRAMALHKLKIDRSFVSGLLGNSQDESVVKAIVGIAREFGLLTTAEGVEDADTRTRLVELGVDRVQGYLIGTPAPATPCVATQN
jgi:PAS domain S-box-containing protein